MEKYLGTGTVAQICQVSPMTIAKWIDEGSLPGHTTPGGHRRVGASDLVRFLERHRMQVPANLRNNNKTRVLAVHSDPDYLGQLAEAMLAVPDRYEYRGTTRGVDALVMVGEWRPNLILLDLTLPDMNGVQICQRFSELASSRDTEIIALAPDPEGDVGRAALAAGVAKCVAHKTKPAKLLGLLTTTLSQDGGASAARAMKA